MESASTTYHLLQGVLHILPLFTIRISARLYILNRISAAPYKYLLHSLVACNEKTVGTRQKELLKILDVRITKAFLGILDAFII